MTFSESTVLESFQNEETIDQWAKKVSYDITSGKCDISSFVECLGFALTSPSVEMRLNGTKLLSATIANLPQEYLNDDQCKFIVSFYTDRLKDHHSVLPAVFDGFKTLIMMKHFPKDCPAKMLTTFFQHVTCQSQVREDREKIYSIIKIICEKYHEEVAKMGPDFVYGVINAIDGERDPRNLLFLFTFIPEFVKKFSLGHLSEELFDSLACYFPIDFHPSKNDPASITREVLADKLGDCLVCTEDFAGNTIDLALEKLESDLIIAKLDSLELIARCTKFQPEVLEEYFDRLWKSIKLEVLPGTDNKDIVRAAFLTLKILLERFAKNSEISKNVQTIIMGDILPNLIDTQHKLFRQSCSVALLCVNSDPGFAVEKVLSSFMLKIRSEECSEEAKIRIWTFVVDVLKICHSKEFVGKIPLEINDFLQNEIVGNLSCGDAELKSLAVTCTSYISISLTPTHRVRVYDIICKAIVQQNNKIDFTQLTKSLALHFAEEFNKHVVKHLLETFCSYDRSVQERVLSNLIILLDIPFYEREIVDFLSKNMFEPSSDDSQLEALRAFENYLVNASEDNVRRLCLQYDIVDGFYNLTMNWRGTQEALQKVSKILNLIVRRLTLEQQNELLHKYIKATRVDTTPNLCLLNGILGFMHQSVNVGPYIENLVQDLIKMSLETNDELALETCNRLLCSVVNKLNDTAECNATISKCVDDLGKQIQAKNENAVLVCSWIAKGLLIKGHKIGTGIAENIVDLLNDKDLCSAASRGIEIIGKEITDIHLPNTTLLAKQRTFHVIFNKLSEQLKTFSEVHINAFMHILDTTPKTVIKMQIEKLDPVLFKCLTLENYDSVLISLNIIKYFLEQRDDYFRSHLIHTVKDLIHLSQCKTIMKIRILALECITAICSYPSYVTEPLKTDVVYGLVPALDDRKRLVRTTAVKARNAWFVLEEVNSKND